jgi:hypothetical protein
MTTLVTTTLEVGLAAILLQSGDGLAAKITNFALGDAGYTPVQSQTGLRNERARFAVAGGKVVGPRQFHVTGKADGPTEFWVREVGFILGDGTFLAVWSDPTKPLAYKASGTDLLLGFDLALAAVPSGSVTVVGTGDLNLSFATEFTQLATGLVRTQHMLIQPKLQGQS